MTIIQQVINYNLLIFIILEHNQMHILLCNKRKFEFTQN